MDEDKSAPAEQDPSKSGSAGTGSTIPKSTDGVSITSTPGGSSFEPEEDAPVPDSEDSAGSGKQS